MSAIQESPRVPEVIVAVDGSPSAVAAIEWAAHDAELRGASLRLIHVVAPIAVQTRSWPEFPAPPDYSQWQEDEARQILDEALKLASEASSPGRESMLTCEVLHGPIVPTLADHSKTADLLVVGCRGRSAVLRVLLGSVSTGVVHHAHCPVAVIHDETPLGPLLSTAPVVVGIDGSPTSELATEIAFGEAARRGVDLVAVHAWSDMGALDFSKPGQAPIEWALFKKREEHILAERLSGWRRQYPEVSVQEVVVSDRPAPRLLERAEAAQLLVVGSRGRGGFAGMLLGSVGEAVVNASLIPVIVARSS